MKSEQINSQYQEMPLRTQVESLLQKQDFFVQMSDSQDVLVDHVTMVTLFWKAKEHLISLTKVKYDKEN